MPGQKDQPIETLLLGSLDQFAVSSSGKPKFHDLIGPKLNDGRAKSLLVHVRSNVLPPTRSEFIKLVIRGRRITIHVALQIREANMDHRIYTSEVS